MKTNRSDKLRPLRMQVLLVALVAMLATVLTTVALPPDAEAQGPPYAGPQTQADGPAFFGPAPNPVPYCESPTYFDPFPENVNPIGEIGPGGGPDASVTTDSITMDFEITAEGDPGGQYPGFFPFGGQGEDNDQPKGVEMAAGDAATVSLSEPLFYSQWVFTDVDRENEGFFVTPTWTDPDAEVAIFGGDANFNFGGNSTEVIFNDTDTNGLDSEEIGGRVQVDLLGAVTGIDIVRDTGSGQSGFAVGGGCEAAGAAKQVVGSPTWNGDSFDVTFELRLRNNLPSGATVAAAILAAQGAADSDFLTGAPSGIPLQSLQFSDDLTDGNNAFSNISVVSLTSPSGVLPTNVNYDGINDTELLAAGAVLAAETDEVLILDVQYTPDLSQVAWADCAAGYTYENQATVSATAANVNVSDVSDDGDNPAPGNDNGDGGVDDPTLVVFECPPADLEIVKTVVPGPAGACPDFAGGVVGDGPTLDVTDQDTVTYCISVTNPGASDATNVVITDPQAPGDFVVGDLAAGGETTVSYDIVVDLQTPTTNTASAVGAGPDGALGPVSDTAVIAVGLLPVPELDIVKTVVEGPNGLCPDFGDGTQGVGEALGVLDTDTVTYCLSVRNIGPGDATNVVVTDTQAPAGFDGSIGALASGDAVDLTYDVTVSLTTPPLNTATVNGDGPYGAVDPDTDDALLLISPQPDPVLEIVKTVIPGPAGVCPTFANGDIGAGAALTVLYGDTATYCITVTNTGGSTATDVTVVDAQAPAGFDGAVGDVAVGQEVTRSYDIVVDAGTPQLNTAVANGTGPNGPLPTVTDQAVIDPIPQPDPVLEIVKTVVAAGEGCPASFDDGLLGLGAALVAEFGDSVTYCITVRNTGGNPATDVIVTDAQAPAGFDGAVGDLAVGQEVALSYAIEVDENTPQVNTAAVGGSGPNGALPDATDQAQIAAGAPPDPNLQIVKTVVAAGQACPATFDDGVFGLGPALPVEFGSSATYCLAVRNVGGSAAINVVVSDTQAPVGFDGVIGDLAVDEVVALTYTVVVDANTPAVNTATVTGAGPNGAVAPASDQALIAPTPPPNPVVEIVKTVVSASETCPATFADGVLGLGQPLPLFFGDSATYCLNVRNSGLSTATNVAVTDAQAPAGFDGAVGDLASGEEAALSYSVAVDANTPTVNTAIVNGDGPNGPLAPDSDQAQIAPTFPADPVLQIVKTVIPAGDTCPATFDDGVLGLGTALPVLFGQSVTYCLNVRNVGGNPATGVVVTDAQAPAGFDGAIGDLGVGDEVALSYDVAVDAGTPEVNTAVVNGNGPNGVLTPATDQAEIASSSEPDPILDIVKTVVAGPNGTCPGYEQGVQGVGDALTVLFGDMVTYCLSVLNSGLRPATDLVITDLNAPASFNGFIGDLGVNVEATVMFDLVVDTNTPLTNTARVDGDGPNGPLPFDSDQALIQPAVAPNPVLDIIKTVVAGPNGQCPDYDNGIVGVGPAFGVLFGDTVTYCLSVINSGLATATDVRITDAQAPADFDGAVGDLVVGAEVTRSFDLVIDANTPAVNTGLVSGNGPNGGVTDSDTAQIRATADPEPNLDIVKTVVSGPSGDCPAFADGVEGVGPALPIFLGDTVTYCLTVLNSGLGDATSVVATDEQAPADFNGDIGTLTPGQEATVTFDLVVDESTPLVNIATVNGEGPNGPVDSDNDLARISPSLVPLPQLVVVKTAVAGPGGTCPAFEDGVVGLGPGLEIMITDSVTYCISVRNVGDGEATDVVINDPQAGGEIAVGTLAPGATFDTTYDVTVTDSTALINTAVASGQGPEGPVGAEDSAQIVATEQLIPSITLTNTVIPITESCENAVESVDEFLVGALGDGVRWCFEVTNTGNTALTDIVLVDLPIGLTSVDVLLEHGNGGASLPAGSSIVFDEEGAIPEDGVTSTASVVGTPSTADGTPIADLSDVTDANDAAVAEAGISIEKLVVAGAAGDCAAGANEIQVNAGTEVTWCFTVTNTGGVDLLVTEVTDSVLDLVVAIPDADQVLAPDASVSVSATTTVSADVENLAKVEGSPLDDSGDPFPGAPVVDDDDTAKVEALSADLAIVKEVSPTNNVRRGATVTFTITVTNLGPDAAADVVVIDKLPQDLSYVEVPELDGWTCLAVAASDFFDDGGSQYGFECSKDESMAVDEEAVFTYEAVVSADAANTAELTNIATVSSSTPDPDETNNEDEATTTVAVPTVIVDPPLIFEDESEPEPEPEDEVLELVITGSSSRPLVLLSTLLLMVGGVLQVGARRRRDHLDG